MVLIIKVSWSDVTVAKKRDNKKVNYEVNKIMEIIEEDEKGNRN